MENTPQNVLTFLNWAKEINTKNPDILQYMLKSSDILDRIIARRIIAAAEGSDHNE